MVCEQDCAYDTECVVCEQDCAYDTESVWCVSRTTLMTLRVCGV